MPTPQTISRTAFRYARSGRAGVTLIPITIPHQIPATSPIDHTHVASRGLLVPHGPPNPGEARAPVSDRGAGSAGPTPSVRPTQRGSQRVTRRAGPLSEKPHWGPALPHAPPRTRKGNHSPAARRLVPAPATRAATAVSRSPSTRVSRSSCTCLRIPAIRDRAICPAAHRAAHRAIHTAIQRSIHRQYTDANVHPTAPATARRLRASVTGSAVERQSGRASQSASERASDTTTDAPADTPAGDVWLAEPAATSVAGSAPPNTGIPRTGPSRNIPLCRVTTPQNATPPVHRVLRRDRLPMRVVPSRPSSASGAASNTASGAASDTASDTTSDMCHDLSRIPQEGGRVRKAIATSIARSGRWPTARGRCLCEQARRLPASETATDAATDTATDTTSDTGLARRHICERARA